MYAIRSYYDDDADLDGDNGVDERDGSTSSLTQFGTGVLEKCLSTTQRMVGG